MKSLASILCCDYSGSHTSILSSSNLLITGMNDSPKSDIVVEQNTGYRKRNRSQSYPMMVANKVQKIAELELQPEIKLINGHNRLHA